MRIRRLEAVQQHVMKSSATLLVMMLLWTMFVSDIVQSMMHEKSKVGPQENVQQWVEPIRATVSECLGQSGILPTSFSQNKASKVSLPKTNPHQNTMATCIHTAMTEKTTVQVAFAVPIPATAPFTQLLSTLVAGATAATAGTIALIVATIVVIVALTVCWYTPGCLDQLRNNINSFYQNNILRAWSSLNQNVPGLRSLLSEKTIHPYIYGLLRDLQQKINQSKENIRQVVLQFINEQTKKIPTLIPSIRKKTLSQMTPSLLPKPTKQKEHEINECPPKMFGDYMPSTSGTNGTSLYDEYTLEHHDEKNRGLTICISKYLIPEKKRNIKETLKKAYHDDVVPHINKLTGLQPQKRVTVYVSAFLWSDKPKYAGLAFGNNILLSDQLHKRNYLSVLVHEMVHVLFNQYKKQIDAATNEGIAVYIECEFRGNVPCYSDYFLRIKTIKREITRSLSLGQKVIYPKIKKWILGNYRPQILSASFYKEQFIRYFVRQMNIANKKTKKSYDPLKEMLQNQNVNSWILNTAIPIHLNSNFLSFTQSFEQFLLSLPDQ